MCSSKYPRIINICPGKYPGILNEPTIDKWRDKLYISTVENENFCYQIIHTIPQAFLYPMNSNK